MTNADVAQIFWGLAKLLKAKKDNIFKIRAYEKVARSIETLETSLAQLAAEDRLTEIDGAGEIIRKKIKEILATGKLAAYEKLKAEIKVQDDSE
ncbi:MAG: hypothetical protein PHR43_01910 [Dehalococcoidales bacterium]|nr:hypothetical protein [Dehalococcoidales bacterium]